MVSRADLESNSDLKRRMVGEMDAWGIVRIADGGKLDGRGYGSKIHDTHGPECCGKTAWISYPSITDTPIEVVPSQRSTSIDFKDNKCECLANGGQNEVYCEGKDFDVKTCSAQNGRCHWGP